MTKAAEEPSRIRVPTRPLLLGPRQRLLVVGGLAVLSILLAVSGYWSFRDAETVPRHEVGFPPPPRLEEAIGESMQRLKENPQDIGALVELGMLQFQKGKEFYPDAINALEEARDLGALDSRVFYCLGLMYQEAGLPGFAVDEYRRYLRNHPDDKEIRMLLAKLLYQQGRYQEAVSEYERLKFHFPKDSLIEENLGLSLWGAKLTDRALESFVVLRSYGADPALRAEFYMGQIAFEQMRFNVALEHITRAIPPEGRELPGLPPERIFSTLALTQQKLNQPEEARKAWEELLRRVPGDAKAQAALKDLNRRFPVKKAKPSPAKR